MAPAAHGASWHTFDTAAVAAVAQVMVGDRPTWKAADHPFRTDVRLAVAGVPTLVQWTPSGVGMRLGAHPGSVPTLAQCPPSFSTHLGSVPTLDQCPPWFRAAHPGSMSTLVQYPPLFSAHPGSVDPLWSSRGGRVLHDQSLSASNIT